MGVGMSKETCYVHDNDWDNLMYYKQSTDNLEFARKLYYRDTRPVCWEGDEFYVSGTMGTLHQALVNVTFNAKSTTERE
ncbi:hypothetical protein DPMN_145345 [Dreissena polymorpha]|uniref:Uncharacterized protein n=1 Tax=Dreissena polymorpha TaxID=45954 RepID=A0A9D4J0Y5_DREPO|nr:hypothetical protein DPMN_145345 [Dreissena polymorpha]